MSAVSATPVESVAATSVEERLRRMRTLSEQDRAAAQQEAWAWIVELGQRVGTHREEALAELWAEVLGMEAVGVHDDFFELGGHSLLATQVISRVRQLFQVSAPLRWLFDAPSVASFSEMLLSDPETGPRVRSLLDRLAALNSLSDVELERRLRSAEGGEDAGWM